MLHEVGSISLMKPRHFNLRTTSVRQCHGASGPSPCKPTRPGQIPVSLGLVWLQPFPRGTPRFPGPKEPRANLPGASPPGHLVAHEGTKPGPSASLPRARVPLVDRSGRISSSLSRATVTERRRRWIEASGLPKFCLRRPERGPLPSASKFFSPPRSYST